MATTMSRVSSRLRRKLRRASSSSWPSMAVSRRNAAALRSLQHGVDDLQVGLADLAGGLLQQQLADDEAVTRLGVGVLRRVERLDGDQQVGHGLGAELLADA